MSDTMLICLIIIAICTVAIAVTTVISGMSTKNLEKYKEQYKKWAQCSLCKNLSECAKKKRTVDGGCYCQCFEYGICEIKVDEDDK